MFTLFILFILICDGFCDCVDTSYSSYSAIFDGLKRIQRISINGHISAYTLETSISDQQFIPFLHTNANPLVIYSTLSHVPSWTHIDVLASTIRISNAFGRSNDDDIRQPLLTLTICQYDTPITSFDDSSYTVSTHRAGLVSMYENELNIVFRSFRSGVFFFSVADQGDVLIAQVEHGTVHIIFDFGSLSPSRISGGRALDDGKWHDIKWIHQFDSVQLSIDGVIINKTTPSGLYRKLDLHNQIHIAGRPPDDFSDGIESSFTGCIAKLYFNSADLLHFAPRISTNKCQMPRPPSITLSPDSRIIIPFSFLPFSFEFRTLPQPSTLLHLYDAANDSLLQTVIENGSLILISNMTKFRQIAHPAINVVDGSWHSFSLRIKGPRLELEIDGYTILWLEGQEVRRISVRLATFVLSATGCYRSTTIDFSNVATEGNVTRGRCDMKDKCLPSPCENGATCIQSSLDQYQCKCAVGFRGRNCHTSDFPRSCEEWYALKGGANISPKGKNITIDLDGGGAMKPFNILCRMDTDELGLQVVTTVLSHDLLRPMIVTGDNSAGAVRKSLQYGIDIEQMDRLVEGFEFCTQYMKYTCRGGAHLMTQGDDRSPSSWYSTRSDKHGLQWGDAPPYSRMCSCSINGTCIHNRMCNCDSGEDATDEGDNPFSQLLPVTALFIGGTTKSSSVQVYIGPLICRNRISFESVTFSDRNSRLSSTKSISSRTFDLSLHIKFTHSHSTIFSWESADLLHWFHLYVQDGKIIGEIVNGGETIQILSDSIYNDGKWHSIYWEADNEGMRLRVDGKKKEIFHFFILPVAYQWTVGSRTGSGSSGFAGVIRNLYICGEEIHLSNMVRREIVRGVEIGEGGYCRQGLCRNGGICVDRYDGYTCDCKNTPFGGSDCTKEYGMYVPMGSSLVIPWQNPAHTSTCHRIAIQTNTNNSSILRAKALFADSSFNISIDESGYLHLSVHDGLFYHHVKSDKKRLISDNILHDISLCATNNDFNLKIDNEPSIYFHGNWTFFQNLNQWTLLDTNYSGCVSRLQIGTSYPLKNPKSARLKFSGKIKFGNCPVDTLEEKSVMYQKKESTIQVSSIANDRYDIISVTTIISLITIGILILLLSCLVCYMRTRPEGVYNTNEGGGGECSPSRSEEPLVNGHVVSKEYFC